MELSEAIFGLVHAVRNNMKQEIKLLSIDLAPMHLKSLKVISIIDNCTGQKLADFMGRDKAQINRLIKELVSQELITKIDNENDKRSHLLKLSIKGDKIIELFKIAEKRVFNKMANDISPEKIDDFIQLTQILQSNLNPKSIE
ncbi:MarR family transcriptional regulator [Colwellia sp. 4_MG-2023]|uniref:MarR family winged helix-turn-helix transcriptional regulator n=1 Tax=unclassified Colwellia TaxID=196834 RepID=UPI001C09F410|nr:MULTISPECIES: MarR family transcriptional regulator [unclassified Colwellia]MBU2925993.1 MarR family transcriptional regulator [Colwellia sp. C2M11]MDO6487021.1 MarR family transcriptional regulator [Colwellia sp. 6_MG-2023]MDO6507700.1 MarR family transcriptional regulator [Colwellia sp. 5_MG-2023]MDO6556302.1 MarR family transcriptional regulator [Colwellia sp. 4_MG-2023]MDO6653133.1 MarR family transcriptional regulator [Colwellia sp. 3_MG-2023]